MADLVDISASERNQNPYLHIDPGFINYRKCFSTFGHSLVAKFQQGRAHDNDPMAAMLNNHLIVDLVLVACRDANVRTLGELLNSPREGQTFSSAEELAGTRDVYKLSRVRNQVLLPYQRRPKVFLEFGAKHIQNDTGRAEQGSRNKVVVVGQVRSVTDTEILLAPLIMGAPSLVHPKNENLGIPMHKLAFYGLDCYETIPDDIDEFAKMKGINVRNADEWIGCMRERREQTVKDAITGLLGDIAYKDWGGEQCDHFSASIHVAGQRMTAGFVLKGPAGGKNFKPLTPSMLGKHGDQIYRLAQTPARLLIIQHCHEIPPSVRATLQAFAVAAHDPRRFCIIDGKDTYRIMKAYGKL